MPLRHRLVGLEHRSPTPRKSHRRTHVKGALNFCGVVGRAIALATAFKISKPAAKILKTLPASGSK